MRFRFPQNSRRLFVSAVIFTAVLGIRLGPWPVDEPVADEPAEIVRPVLPVRFRDPAALEAVVPTPRREARLKGFPSTSERANRIVHHTSARHSPPLHLTRHTAGAGHS
jgi:hypothetical protein